MVEVLCKEEIVRSVFQTSHHEYLNSRRTEACSIITLTSVSIVIFVRTASSKDKSEGKGWDFTCPCPRQVPFRTATSSFDHSDAARQVPNFVRPFRQGIIYQWLEPAGLTRLNLQILIAWWPCELESYGRDNLNIGIEGSNLL
jgi:hypothetical protein